MRIQPNFKWLTFEEWIPLTSSNKFHGPYNTKQGFVYQALRDAIMRGELPPGHRLVIQAIADEYDVSHIPIREALRLLESENLVEHKPHVGAFVAPITSSSIVEIFTIKEALETAAARVAVNKLTLNDISALDNKVDEMETAIEEQRFEDWGNLNAAFHEAIVALTDMPMLKETYRHVIDRWNRVRRYFFKDVLFHRLIHSQQEHRLILENMKARNIVEVEKLIKTHNQDALRNYMEHLSKQEVDFGH